MTFQTTYNKNYKKLLVIPSILLAISLIYLTTFYIQTGDFINKDVSLTGGTTITIFSDINPQQLKTHLTQKLSDFELRTLSDSTGKQTQIIIIVPEEQSQQLQTELESYLNTKLTSENSSKETTSSTLSQDFYKQLIIAVLLAFFWMAAVVFLIFSKGKKRKFLVIILNIIFGILLGLLFTSFSTIAAILTIILAAFLIYTYIKNSVPSFAVLLSAFADITMTLALVNFLGMKISTAGIVAFLMLIGYSVDTDILLTTRILKRRESINQALFSAFKTGTTMTLTSIIAIATALIVIFSFQSVLNQIFTILLIGLGFDLLNTWVTNASIIKWYAENNESKE